MTKSKNCSKCKEMKPAESFFPDSTKSTGLSSQCRTCVAERSKAWKANNPDKVKADRVRYLSENREWLRDRHAKQRFETKQSILEKLGSVCCKCGYADERALQLDHIDGGGSAERKADGFDWWVWIRKLDSMDADELAAKIQILCANCNQIKRVENNEYGAGKKGRRESAGNCTCIARNRSACSVHAHLRPGNA